MIVTPFNNLSLPASGVEISQPIGMGDFNAVQMSAVIHYIGGSVAPTVVIQVSNDMENWLDKATPSWVNSSGATTFNDEGAWFQSGTPTSIGFAYIRIKVTAGGSSSAIIISINANLSRQ